MTAEDISKWDLYIATNSSGVPTNSYIIQETPAEVKHVIDPSTLFNLPGIPSAYPVPVSDGGTGATSLTAHDLLVGNGTSTITGLAPGTSGNVATSNGTNWTSAAPATPTVSVKQADRQLTALEIENWATTALTIVPAPGAGKAIIPISVTLSSGAGSNWTGGGFIQLITGAIVWVQLTNNPTVNQDFIECAFPNGAPYNGGYLAYGGIENLPLQVNGTVNLTGGSILFTVSVVYYEVTLQT